MVQLALSHPTSSIPASGKVLCEKQSAVPQSWLFSKNGGGGSRVKNPGSSRYLDQKHPKWSSLISPRRSGPRLRLGCPAAWDDSHRAIHGGSPWTAQAKPFLPAGHSHQHPLHVPTQGHLLSEAYQKRTVLGNWRLSLKSTHVPVPTPCMDVDRATST